nr:hypothetical protein [Tanacetum cinerariifolium]
MSADVARGHDSDGGSDDRLPPHQIRGGCRGNGTRKPNMGGIKASRLNTRKETKNLGLRKITDQFVLQEIQFEWNDRDTLMPLGDHAAHWANLLREIVREFPMHFCSWHNPRRAEGEGLGKDWGTYTNDHFMDIVRRGKQWGHILDVGRVLAGRDRDLQSEHEVGSRSGSGGGGDDDSAMMRTPTRRMRIKRMRIVRTCYI